jgi:dihydropteroate synthase
MRPIFEWKLRSRTLTLGKRTLIMGVVNVTPDSFSDGGQFFAPSLAIEHGLELLAEGADILDIGGESTRPGIALELDAAEEQRRVIPVIEDILRQRPEALISIDTYKAPTARAAIASGAEIVNDVSGFTWDEQMLSTLAETRCGCVLMHTRGRPAEWRNLPPLHDKDVLPLVKSELRHLAQRALAAGIEHERIVLDPGFGFGKRLNENFPLLGHLRELHELGFPVLAGPSRKSFIAKAAGAGTQVPISERLAGTIAAVTASILQGAHLIRAHDVGPALEAARVADAVLAHL